MLGGMQDFELRVPRLLDHAAREHARREIVTYWADGTETRTDWGGIARDAKKLEAMLKLRVPGVRGCFPRLSAASTTLSQVWWTRVGWGCEIFPAVYH
mgnify:CR=1 FL=1